MRVAASARAASGDRSAGLSPRPTIAGPDNSHDPVNYVCGNCDPSLCFTLGLYDRHSPSQTFTQTVDELSCTDLGYDRGDAGKFGFFLCAFARSRNPPDSSGR